MSFTYLTVKGLLDQHGQRFVSISRNGQTATVAHRACLGRAEVLLNLLAAHGLVLTGADAIKNLLDNVQSVTNFEAALIIESPGYADGRFTLGDGSIFGPDADNSKIAFATDASTASEAGTLEGWRDQVADAIGGQYIPMTVVLFAFGAPLAAITGRPLCRSIEFVASPSSGIDILPVLLASVTGAPARQFAQFAQTANSPVTPFHNDAAVPVVGSDAFMMGETLARRVLAVKSYLFPTLRAVQEDLAAHRPGCLVSFSNEPLLAHVDEGIAFRSATAGHHVSVRLTSERRYGVFESLPKGFPNSAALASHLATQASQQHGVALRRFLSHVTGASFSNPAELGKRVERYINAFRKAAASDRNNHCDAAVTDTFATAYAAGRIAQDAGILPSDWMVSRATIRCYRRYLYRPALPRNFKDVLQEIASGSDVVHLDGSEQQAEVIQRAQVFVLHRKRGNELLVRRDVIRTTHPNLYALMATPDAENVMVKETGHRTVKRRLTSDVVERVYCFRLPSAG